MNITDSFFQQRPDIRPIIYAYELVGVESHKGYIKVGETTRSAAERIREQTHTVAVKFRVLDTWSALRGDGTVFRDHDVRAVLLKRGFQQLNEGEDRNEWHRCSLGDVKPAVSSAWREDLTTHIDFEGWQFVGRGERTGEPSMDEQYLNPTRKGL